MGLSASDEELALAGVPAGLVARPLREHRRSDDGLLVEVRTRRGQRKTDRVELVPAGTPIPLDLEPSEKRWLLSAGERRWAGVRSRYGDQAWTRAVELTRAGIVRLRCVVDERFALGQAYGWTLSEEWDAHRVETTRLRQLDRDQLRVRAVAAADAVAERCPELAAALQTAVPGSPTTPVLIYAAEDLVQGVLHFGPRAFSQAHFEHTKTRDDVAQVLLDAGVPRDVLIELGIRRSARVGVAGPVTATVDGTPVAIELLDGPVLLRADQRRLELQLLAVPSGGSVEPCPSLPPLVVVENLQAAETIADQLPNVALLYTAGLPGKAALNHIGSLASHAERVLVIPDADLGGVRIAEAVLSVAPAGEVVDVGKLPHPPRTTWPAEGVSRRGLDSALSGRARDLARACLDRGYPVEQEIATIGAVKQALGTFPPA